MAHGSSSFPFFSWPSLLPRKTATTASNSTARCPALTAPDRPKSYACPPCTSMQTNFTAILKLWQHALLRPCTSEGDICSQGGLWPCQQLLSPAPCQPDPGVSFASAPSITLPSPLAQPTMSSLWLHVPTLCAVQNAGLGAQKWGMAVQYSTAWSFPERQLKRQILMVKHLPTTHRTSHLLFNPLHHSKLLAVTRVSLQTTYPDKTLPPAWCSPFRYISHSCYLVFNVLDSEK